MMADAAHAIHNGYVRVHGTDTTTFMCYAHVMRAIDRRKFTSNANKAEIKNDIRRLHLSRNEEQFNRGCHLFAEKWNSKELHFVEYFDTYWVQRNQNWYIGTGFRNPCTNNALESFNGSLKIHHTHYNIVGLSVFKVELMKIVGDRSKEYEKDRKPFISEITITNKMHQDGWQMIETHDFIHKKEGETAVFYIAEKDKLTQDLVDTYLTREFNTFQEFFNRFFFCCLRLHARARVYRLINCFF